VQIPAKINGFAYPFFWLRSTRARPKTVGRVTGANLNMKTRLKSARRKQIRWRLITLGFLTAHTAYQPIFNGCLPARFAQTGFVLANEWE
jgi:hypothetical protein